MMSLCMNVGTYIRTYIQCHKYMYTYIHSGLYIYRLHSYITNIQFQMQTQTLKIKPFWFSLRRSCVDCVDIPPGVYPWHWFHSYAAYGGVCVCAYWYLNTYARSNKDYSSRLRTSYMAAYEHLRIHIRLRKQL